MDLTTAPDSPCGDGPTRGGRGSAQGADKTSSSTQLSKSATANQALHWCFTSFLNTKQTSSSLTYQDGVGTLEALRACLETLSDADVISWAVVGLEVCPTTQRLHFQGFMKLSARKRLEHVVKLFPKSTFWQAPHFEMMSPKSTVEANYQYCRKIRTMDPIPNEHWFEVGERPAFETAGTREKNRWKQARESALGGDVNDVEDDQIYVSFYKGLCTIAGHNKRAKHLEAHGADLKKHFVWVYGPPGTGKTRLFYEECAKKGLRYYLKHPLNHWWDGYSDQEMVLLDDFPKTGADHMMFRLKQWLTEFPFPAEFKGGHSEIRPKNIFITSNFHWREVFAAHDERELEALERRLATVYLGPPGKEYKPVAVAPGFTLARENNMFTPATQVVTGSTQIAERDTPADAPLHDLLEDKWEVKLTTTEGWPLQ